MESQRCVRVRLHPDRLRAYGLSVDDVMKAFEESTILESSRRVDPPLGVLFVTPVFRPDQYEELILKASAEGEAVRLRDVCKVELLADGGRSVKLT